MEGLAVDKAAAGPPVSAFARVSGPGWVDKGKAAMVASWGLGAGGGGVDTPKMSQLLGSFPPQDNAQGSSSPRGVGGEGSSVQPEELMQARKLYRGYLLSRLLREAD